MSLDLSKYLATEILSEQRTLSYRALARAQKVHVNTAKCLLYEFHEKQTKKKPGSLYATYLIGGIKKPQIVHNDHVNGATRDEDEPMRSSPPQLPSSMNEASQQDDNGGISGKAVRTHTITLVREESLEGRRA
jgi:DNA polymerase delta subunit 3